MIYTIDLLLFINLSQGIHKTVLVNITTALKCVQKPPVTSFLSQDQHLCQVTVDTPVHSVRNLEAAALLTITGNQTVQPSPVQIMTDQEC
jgi:hypothetical protein